MVAPRRPPLAVHALLDHRPSALVGDEEAVQVEVEPVLERGAVDLGDEPARAGQVASVEPGLVARGGQLRRVAREWRPRPPQTLMPSSPARGLRPRFSAPMTLVVIPDECQSIPITAPNDWNQKGWASRERKASRPS
jgi:hypothetical protein